MARPTLCSKIKPLVLKGYTNQELVAVFTDAKITTILVTASKLRKKFSITKGRTSPGRPLYMPLEMQAALKNEALCRTKNLSNDETSPHFLALKLLSIIIKDNLFDAILGKIGEKI